MESEIDDSLHIPNPFDGQPFPSSDSLRQKSLLHLMNNILQFYRKVNPRDFISIASVPQKSSKDYSTFEGSGGHLIAFVKLYLFFKRISAADLEFLNKSITTDKQKVFLDAEKYAADVQSQIQSIEHLIIRYSQDPSKYTFFFSPAGVYLTAMIFYASRNETQLVKEYLYKILQLQKGLLQPKKKKVIYHEILYGSTGYLYNLLFIQKHFYALLSASPANKEILFDLNSTIQSVFILTVQSGLHENFKEEQPDYRLVYDFHSKEYIGGAHGLAGICLVLKAAMDLNPQLRESYRRVWSNLVAKSMGFVASLQHKSGNFPTGPHRSERDEMIQFCHGAPGIVAPLLAFATPTNGFLKSAEAAGECIWKRGILRKGFGICHGISGNGYAFLSLYRHTKNTKWLNYALTFATLVPQDSKIQWEISTYQHYDRYIVGSSDYPYSYMMGLAGDISFQIDCLYPETSMFYGYEM